MAMSKTGFDDAVIGTASVKVELNQNGNIAIDGDTVAGSKRISFNTVNADATMTNIDLIADVFLKVLPGEDAAGDYDNLQTTFTVKWGVA